MSMIVFLKPVPGCALLCSLLFTPTTSAQSRPPVILVDGGQDCIEPATFGFGRLEAMLADKGIRTELFRPCSVPSKSAGERPPIEELADALAARINELSNPEVDLVAFSLGGPIVRCYLSGKQTAPGVFKPPAEHKVRKLVFLGAGQFGGWSDNVQLSYGGRFQWDLANWNQGHDLLRQVDAVALVAFVGTEVKNRTIPLSSNTDGAVSMVSGSLSFAYPAERTRIIPGCHLRVWCSPGVSYVSSDQDPAWLVVDSFLSGTDGWKTVGHAPDQDAVLSRKGGLMVAVKDAWDNLIQDAQVSISGRVMGKGGAGDSVVTFVEEQIEAGAYTLQVSASFPVPDRTVTVIAGTFAVVTMKPGPLLAGIETADSESRSPNITAGAIISLRGERLADAPIAAQAPFPTILGSTTVRLNDRPIPLLYVSESQIKAQLPDDAIGFGRLTVTSDKGTHGLNLFIRERNPEGLTVVSATDGRARVAPRSIASAYGLNLALSLAAGGDPPPETLNGVTVTMTDAQGDSRTGQLYFVSAGQVIFVMPAAAPGAARVVVNNNGVSSSGSVDVVAVAPGLFAANGNGQGVVAGVAVRVSAAGPQSVLALADCSGGLGQCVPVPLSLGDLTDQTFLTLYGTGLRNASRVSAALGGVAAEVLYFGALSQYPGLDQVDVRVPRGLSGRGVVEVVLTADDQQANRVTVAVQ